MEPNAVNFKNELSTPNTSQPKASNDYVEILSDEFQDEFKRISGKMYSRPHQEQTHSICLNNQGNLVMASSRFSNKWFQGFLRKYNNITSLNGECGSGLDLRQSMCKKVISTVSNHLVAALHSGSIVICDSDLNSYKRFSPYQDPLITAACDRQDGTRLISIAKSCTLRVFDVHRAQLAHKFSSGRAVSLDFVSNSNSKFVTSGNDKCVYMWDLNVSNPCSHYGALKSTPTSIQWSAVDDNIFYIGTEFGELISFDARKVAIDLGNKKICERPIRKIYCEANCIALLSNNERENEFCVLEEKSLKNLYFTTSSPEPFSDFIFYQNNFYTVSIYNQIVIQHKPDFN